MAAYLISDLTVLDDVAFDNYGTRAAAAMAEFGGRYLVRVGEIQVLEGAWNPRSLVVVEFPSMEQARAWHDSAAYAQALEYRDKALSRNMIFVDGVSAPAS